MVIDKEKYTSGIIDQVILSRTEYENLRNENLFLKQELDKLKRMIFGAKSERFIPVDSAQLPLFGLPQVEATEPVKESITYERNKPSESKKNPPIRLALPAHLPRVEEVIEPKEDISEAKKIGETITEILEYTPGKLFVKKYIRPKYVLPNKESIVIGQLPSLPIPRGNAGPGLLSHMLISKFVDHLPFYRQVQMFKRQEIQIAESTINDWFTGTCRLLEPLYEKLKEKVQQCDYLMADETPIAVLSRDHSQATHKGYHWFYYSPVEKLVCVDYQQGRGRDGPTAFLKDFYGAIQTDGYSVYDIFEMGGKSRLLGCMAHARRKFDQALNNDRKRAQAMLTMMQPLYQMEQIAKEYQLSIEERQIMRQVMSTDHLKKIEEWLKDNLVQVLPKSAIGQAIAYTLNLWPRLIRYIEDGRFEIDNNLVENSIRPVALGRKNYLFAGSHEGAKRAAMIYSFLGTCKKNHVEPFTWLKDVLTVIPDWSIQRLDELLPVKPLSILSPIIS